MIPLFLAFGTSFCTYTVNVDNNEPTQYTFALEETEHICINSSVPYLSIVFDSSSLVKMEIYEKRYGNISFRETQYFPTVHTGYDFSNSIVSFDIEPLLSCLVSFKLFSFPNDCDYRYISNFNYDEFTIHSKFGKVLSHNKVCIWYTNRRSQISIDSTENLNLSEQIQVCTSEIACKPYNSNMKMPNKNLYLTISHIPENYESKIGFSFEALDPEIIVHPFSNILSKHQPTLFEVQIIHFSAKENDEDYDESELDLVLVVIFVILVSILILLLVFSFIALNWLRKPKEIDDSTRSLLRPDQNNEFPANYYPTAFPYHQSQNQPQYFAPGVFVH